MKSKSEQPQMSRTSLKDVKDVRDNAALVSLSYGRAARARMHTDKDKPLFGIFFRFIRVNLCASVVKQVLIFPYSFYKISVSSGNRKQRRGLRKLINHKISIASPYEKKRYFSRMA